MGFKQWSSVLFVCFLLQKLHLLFINWKILNGYSVNVHFLMMFFDIALGNYFHFEYFMKLKEEFM